MWKFVITAGNDTTLVNFENVLYMTWSAAADLTEIRFASDQVIYSTNRPEDILNSPSFKFTA